MSELDPVIHAPKRLRIMAMLAAVEEVTFSRVQGHLGVTAPDLSKQIRTLYDAGYVTTRRSGRGPGSQVWLRLTRPGARAYRAHVQALSDLLDGSIPATKHGVPTATDPGHPTGHETPTTPESSAPHPR